VHGPSSSPIRIFLLGRCEVTRGKRTLSAADWTRRKAQTLLARLALEPARRLLKDQALDLLWPDQSSAAASNNLYRTLHALRQTLDTTLGAGAAEATVSFEDGVLSLDAAVWVDVSEFDRLCATPAHDERYTTHLQQALALYQGDLLPDELYADWTMTPRAALRRQRREISLVLATQDRQAQRYADLIARLTPLLAHDAADEVVHRELMRAYALSGRRHDALRQYQTCVEALAADLDVPPEPETTALYDQILSGQLSPRSAPAVVNEIAAIGRALSIGPSRQLIGREVEFETLRHWLENASGGRGTTVLIAGEAGAGKTLLAGEALCAAAGAGLSVLFGAAYEQEGQLAYQPFSEAFDRYLTDGRQASSANPITHFQRRGASDPQQEQWALFRAVADFLIGLSAQAPVVMLLDDLHAADEASLHLFHYLARQTRQAPVVLLATYRTDLAAASPLGDLLNALYRERLSETLALERLSKDAIARLLEQLLGGKPAPDLASAIDDTTEGNPFFVREISRALVDEERVEQRQGQWRLKRGAEVRASTELSDLLRARVTRLGAATKTALTAAAVIGREFGFDVLRGASALPDSSLLDALDLALTSHLLEETESGYRFQHSLIRKALYDSLSRTRRARLHGLAAETIESVYTRRPGGLETHIEDLAFHYDLSDRRERALDYLIRAGQKAAGVYYAFEVAVDYFERALTLMDVAGVADSARRWMILESLGWWHTILADTPRAVARFEQAIALPPSEDWRSARRDRVRLHRGSVVALITAGDTVAAEAHLRAALAEIDEQDDAAEYAHLLYNVAQFHWHRSEYREAFDAAQKSLGVAERLNEPVAIARAFEMLALACHSLGEWQTGVHYEQQRASLAGPGLDVTEAFDVHL
jgi:DNA-binding SARP family transcriptional activator